MRTVDLFAGCGGMSLGFQQAGFEVAAAFDNWKPALEVYRANFGHPALEADLSDVEKNLELIQSFCPEVIIGGPPCQDFSHAGKREKEGSRADLTLAFARIIAGIQPNFFVMENVDQIHKSKRLSEAKTVFKRARYGLSEITLEAADFGVPQYRKRYFLFGKLDSADNLFDFTALTPTALETSVRAYFRQNELTLDTEFYYRHPRTYARRAIYSLDEPSPTIRGVNRPIPKTYQAHPLDAALPSEAVRPLSTLERSYIQTFPKDFVWLGSKTNLEQMIGNAVPVLLAQTVARLLFDNAAEQVRDSRVVQEALFV